MSENQNRLNRALCVRKAFFELPVIKPTSNYPPNQIIALVVLIGPKQIGKTFYAKNINFIVNRFLGFNVFVIPRQANERILLREVTDLLIHVRENHEENKTTIFIIEESIDDYKERLHLMALGNHYKAHVLQVFFKYCPDEIRNSSRYVRRWEATWIGVTPLNSHIPNDYQPFENQITVFMGFEPYKESMRLINFIRSLGKTNAIANQSQKIIAHLIKVNKEECQKRIDALKLAKILPFDFGLSKRKPDDESGPSKPSPEM